MIWRACIITVTDFHPAYKAIMVHEKVCLQVTMVWLFCGPVLHQVKSASSEIHLELLDHLMRNYTNPFMRPVNDTTVPVEVGLRYTPVFSTLDETNEQLKVRGMLALTWKDYRLQWIPADYGNITETNIPLLLNDEQKVWIPEVSLYECLVTDFRSFYPETTGVTLIHTGQIHWYTLATTQTYCMVDNKKFPFDVQACTLTFTTWLYQSNEQIFYTIDDLVTNDTFKKYEMHNALWTVKIKDVEVEMRTYDCETCQGEKQSFIRYNLELTRGQSGFLVLMFVSPCIVIAILTTFVTYLRGKEEVDAPSYALTCVLTLYVYLIFLYSALPPTGGPSIGILITLMVLGGVFAVVYIVCLKHDCYLNVKGRASGRNYDSTGEFELQGASSDYGATSAEDGDSGQDRNDGHGTENVESDHTVGGNTTEETLPIVGNQATKSTNVLCKYNFCNLICRRCRSVDRWGCIFIAYQLGVFIAVCSWLIHVWSETRK